MGAVEAACSAFIQLCGHGPAHMAVEKASTPLSVAIWLAVGSLAHALIALFAVLSRYLQVGAKSNDLSSAEPPKAAAAAAAAAATAALLIPLHPQPAAAAVQTRPAPPLPALRLALILNFIALAALVALEVGRGVLQHVLAVLVPDGAWRCKHLHQLSAEQGEEQHTEQQTEQQQDEQRQQQDEQQQQQQQQQVGSGMQSSSSRLERLAAQAAADVPPSAACPLAANNAGLLPSDEQQHASCAPDVPGRAGSPGDAATSSFQRQDTLYGRRFGAAQRQVPDVYLARGMSGRMRRLERHRPDAVRWAALAALASTYAVGSTSQIVAAGWVDASVSESHFSWGRNVLLKHCLQYIVQRVAGQPARTCAMSCCSVLQAMLKEARWHFAHMAGACGPVPCPLSAGLFGLQNPAFSPSCCSPAGDALHGTRSGAGAVPAAAPPPAAPAVALRPAHARRVGHGAGANNRIGELRAGGRAASSL